MAFLNHSTKTHSKNLILCEVLQGRHRGKKKKEKETQTKKRNQILIYFFFAREWRTLKSPHGKDIR